MWKETKMELLTFNEVWKRSYDLRNHFANLEVESYFFHFDSTANALNKQKKEACLYAFKALEEEKDCRLREWSLVELVMAAKTMSTTEITRAFMVDVSLKVLVGLKEPLESQKKELEDALAIIQSNVSLTVCDYRMTKDKIVSLLVKLNLEIEERRRLAVAMSMHHRLGSACALGKLPDSLMPALFPLR
jgi:hypothetical protein